MKILLVHSYYQQRGGEDAVFRAERDLLIKHGETVETCVLDNAEYVKKPRWRQLAALFWNRRAYQEIKAHIARFGPEVMHVHNLFPFFSPAVIIAAHEEDVPVVMTLHNYRLLCANGLLFREGKPCEKCVRRWIPWPAVRHACYRGDRFLSALVAASFTWHRWRGSWRKISLFIAPTAFAAKKFRGRIPPAKLMVKPHFAREPQTNEVVQKLPYALYAGRVSEEKGIIWLLNTWQKLEAPFTLKIAGTGPLENPLREAFGGDMRIEWLGQLPPETLAQTMAQAAFVIVPSLCYETFGNVVAEAFAAGTGVIAPEGGAPGTLLESGISGVLYQPQNEESLLVALVRLIDEPARWQPMGDAAREIYRARYTPEKNYEMLVAAYHRALR